MSKILISYRRQDSIDVTGRIHDRLVKDFGPGAVFMDVDSIPYGVDFRTYLDEQVAKCEVFLAVIGRDWLRGKERKGKSRLEDPGDFVRIEIESALKRRILVIPVLVGGATVPPAHQLPTSIQDLSYRHAIVIRPNPDFHRDMDRLIDHLKAQLDGKQKHLSLPDSHHTGGEVHVTGGAGNSEAARPEQEGIKAAVSPLGLISQPDARQPEHEVPIAFQDASRAANDGNVTGQEAHGGVERLGEDAHEVEASSSGQDSEEQEIEPGREAPAESSAALQSTTDGFPSYMLGGIGLIVLVGAVAAFLVLQPKSSPVYSPPVVEKKEEQQARMVPLAVPSRPAEPVAVPKKQDQPMEKRAATSMSQIPSQAEVKEFEQPHGIRGPIPSYAFTLLNDAGQDINIYLGTENNSLAKQTLQLREMKSFSDGKSTQYIIKIPTQGGKPVNYHLFGGKRYRIFWNDESQRWDVETLAHSQKQETPVKKPVAARQLSMPTPQVIQIPLGSFMMGGSGDQNEAPIHEVRFTKPFAMARYETTFDEYDSFARATGRPLPKDEGWGRGQRPVINVSWKDAQAYAQWLSQQTGWRYRLPTEAEWEFAARSGGKDEIWAGTSNETRLKDYAVFQAKLTEPVGSNQPNGLGLYDMSGNVWEWVEDCWHENYSDAPTGGSAWLESNGGNCGRRVLRGGAWLNDPENLRASNRGWTGTRNRGLDLGFRLVQDLP